MRLDNTIKRNREVRQQLAWFCKLNIKWEVILFLVLIYWRVFLFYLRFFLFCCVIIIRKEQQSTQIDGETFIWFFILLFKKTTESIKTLKFFFNLILIDFDKKNIFNGRMSISGFFFFHETIISSSTLYFILIYFFFFWRF